MTLEIIDFHTHYAHPDLVLTTDRRGNSENRRRWARLNRLVQDEEALLAHVRSGDLVGRVVSTPAEFLADENGEVPPDRYRQINEHLSALCGRHPGQIHALASVDAFGGDHGARELEHAIRNLGLHGLFVPSARGDLLLDAPEARPVLETAAALGVPVFVHPINLQPLTDRMEPYGRLGTLFARGTINSATLIALLEAGILRDLPDLRIVLTGLAVASILLTAAFGAEQADDLDRLAILRRQVHVETMGFDPVLIRAFVDTLGPSQIIAGSDWPIVSEAPIRERLRASLTAAGLDESQQQAVARDNLLGLLVNL
ncbi:amidohydrolase [Arsenicitalea aurantiaca]|uniref:Amidohydrolase n=1 Tax=Arsenicitalea aurantiaca TaxID=1783274 RepID=A0A433X2I3_9HYPH|nr:amidohydrolase family protein [Arsenicitalea aurantiaca]RUT28295.1 amidohydrolase [Arsenicitalea aurantiaca]